MASLLLEVRGLPDAAEAHQQDHWLMDYQPRRCGNICVIRAMPWRHPPPVTILASTARLAIRAGQLGPIEVRPGRRRAHRLNLGQRTC